MVEYIIGFRIDALYRSSNVHLIKFILLRKINIMIIISLAIRQKLKQLVYLLLLIIILVRRYNVGMWRNLRWKNFLKIVVGMYCRQRRRNMLIMLLKLRFVRNHRISHLFGSHIVEVIERIFFFFLLLCHRLFFLSDLMILVVRFESYLFAPGMLDVLNFNILLCILDLSS
jgi:hypothetical protein